MPEGMKYFLIAGEASGDLHASRLMSELKAGDPDARFRYMGGDLMQAVAPGLIMHYKNTSYMLLHVLLHLRKIFRNMALVKEEIRTWAPDVVIPVDYPGFNLPVSRHARKLGFPVYYYISPKVWVWKEYRVRQLKRDVKHLFCILPFEVGWFRQHQMEVEYFGNPLVDAVGEFKEEFKGREHFLRTHGLEDKPLVALLAGSRIKEVEGVLPTMVRVASHFPDYQFVVAGAPSLDPSLYEPLLEGSQVKIVYEGTYGLLASAHAAMVTSGTATLETALFGVPQVVMYRTSPFLYRMAKMLVNLTYVSLVNLILERYLLKEVVGKKLYAESKSELARILGDGGRYTQIVQGYEELEGRLESPGVVGRVARRMLNLLKAEVRS